jgi:penicillin-binding protein 2
MAVVHAGMRDVINSGGGGTGSSARLNIPGVEMAGKTGSAQVRRITMADRRAGRTSSEALAWRFRDHGHFIGFAPVEQPRYAIGVALEHGNHGAAAGQVARDVMTYLFAPDRAMATLAGMEKGWGGDIATRMAADVQHWNQAHSPAPVADAMPEPSGNGQEEEPE